MARDYTKARLYAQLTLSAFEGVRPSGALDWVSAVAPALTQAAVGAGHWAAGRRQRALAAWACAAGSGLVAWGLATEAPTRAEAEVAGRQKRDLLRELGARGLGPETPAPAGTQAPARQRSLNAISALGTCSQVVFGVRSGLRRPQRLTGQVIASETFNTASYVLRAVRAGQQRRPRIAAGRALGAAGSLARLRAASAEPLPSTARHTRGPDRLCGGGQEVWRSSASATSGQVTRGTPWPTPASAPHSSSGQLGMVTPISSSGGSAGFPEVSAYSSTPLTLICFTRVLPGVGDERFIRDGRPVRAKFIGPCPQPNRVRTPVLPKPRRG